MLMVPVFPVDFQCPSFVFPPVPGLSSVLGPRVFENRTACRKSSDKYQNELIMPAVLFWVLFCLSSMEKP